MYENLKNKFITFEGGEGSGKTTQIKLLVDHLTNYNLSITQTKEPGGSIIGDQIRNILLHPKNYNLSYKSELLLYAAARAQHIEEIIKPALNNNQTVICDRFTDSTIAYQGYGRELDMKLIKLLNDLSTNSLIPDITLYLDIDPTIGIKRSLDRQNGNNINEDRMEQESIEFHKKIRHGFLELAKSEPKRFIVIDANQTIEQIHSEILRKLT